MPSPDLEIEKHGPSDLLGLKDALLEVYAEVYADRLDDPFFSTPRYSERLEGYASRDGFAVTLGKLGGEVIGYALGYTLPKGSGWWRGLQPDDNLHDTSETGNRTFALTEIMTREKWRRRGYARTMHNALLAGRAEERATLLVLPENTPAKTAYLTWGWHRVGSIQPFSDSPVYDSMVFDLRG